MTTAPATRPLVITVLGWCFVAIAVVSLLVGWHGLGSRPAHPVPPSALTPQVAAWTAAEARLAHVSSALALLSGALLLVGAAQLLRGREGGRRVLEAVCWFGLVYVNFTALWTAFVSGPMLASYAHTSRGFFLLGTLVSAVAQLAVIGALLYFLRSHDVREAMQA